MGLGLVAAPKRSQRRWLRAIRALILVSIVLGLAVTSMNCATTYLVKRTDAHLPRDPETGVLLGAEPRNLGPKDAPGVAILVHGFIGAGDNFDGLPEAIAATGWRVRVMRLPGHGTSPIDFEHTTEDELIDAVGNEVAAMRREHQKVVLIGHSMGATISTIVAARQPVDGLVLAGAYFGVTQKWYYILPVETWVHTAGPLVKWLYKGTFFMRVNKPGVKDKITSYRWVGINGTKTLMRLGHMARDPEVLQSIHCPVLLVHSEIDEAADPGAARRAFDAIASDNKQALWLERSNHIIFWDYEADEVESAICTFLQSLQTDTAPPDRKESS